LCKHRELRQFNNKQEVKPLAGSELDSKNDRQMRPTRWGRIYAGVAGFTVVVILLMYMFSRHYSG